MGGAGKASARRGCLTPLEAGVIVTVAVLLYAVLYPVLHRPRGHARESQCRYNLRAIGVALGNYSHDYDERLPGCTMGSERRSWRVLLMPYWGGTSPFLCPSSASRNQVGLSLDGRHPISYAANGCSANIGGEAPMAPNKGYPLGKLESLGQLILVAESNSPRSDIPFDAPIEEWRRKQALFAGHNGQATFLYADGHVKASPPLQTVGGQLHAGNLWAVNQHDKPAPQSLVDRLQACEKAYR